MFFEGNINDWRPKANCVGCYLINENGATSHELLYLRRPSDDPFYPAQWGAPAGSIELGESLSQAAIQRSAGRNQSAPCSNLPCLHWTLAGNSSAPLFQLFSFSRQV